MTDLQPETTQRTPLRERFSRKRVLGIGAALLLVAGVATGGALTTMNAVVADNEFATDIDAALTVTGSPLSHTFSAVAPSASGVYRLNNHSSDALVWSVKSILDPDLEADSEEMKLAGMITATLESATGTPIGSMGTLADMSFEADGLTYPTLRIPANGYLEFSISMSVDPDEIFDAGLNHAAVTADFFFTAMPLTNP